jgi:hypothetical protein
MKFFETFPTLKLPQDLADYMKDVEVVDIRKSSTNTLVRIITSSQILISKRVIFKVQDALKKQVFRTKQMKVRILDRYRLSQAYTPEYLINEYKESIELELDKYWTVAGSLFKNGSYEFKKPYEMTIVLEEGELASQFTGQIQEYFRMMFKNRFLMDVDVVCTTKERVNNRYERENEHLLAIKVQQISAQFEKAKSEAAEKEKENTTSGTNSGNTTSSGSGDSEDDGDKKYCTIQIRCDTILNNLGNLTPGKEAYVPANGIILATSELAFEDGETVFDVLQRACNLAGIQIEYSYTPIYESYYIEGLNHLYEFDCGNLSGWMYKVNGWFPNYGCSSYILEDGDNIVWCYTCNGAGADVGGSNYR